jgi:hypothetical protein
MVNYICMDVESYDKWGEWEAKITLERNHVKVVEIEVFMGIIGKEVEVMIP